MVERKERESNKKKGRYSRMKKRNKDRWGKRKGKKKQIEEKDIVITKSS